MLCSQSFEVNFASPEYAPGLISKVRLSRVLGSATALQTQSGAQGSREVIITVGDPVPR
jgi:hypothetical protein